MTLLMSCLDTNVIIYQTWLLIEGNPYIQLNTVIRTEQQHIGV